MQFLSVTHKWGAIQLCNFLRSWIFFNTFKIFCKLHFFMLLDYILLWKKFYANFTYPTHLKRVVKYFKTKGFEDLILFEATTTRVRVSRRLFVLLVGQKYIYMYTKLNPSTTFGGPLSRCGSVTSRLWQSTGLSFTSSMPLRSPRDLGGFLCSSVNLY